MPFSNIVSIFGNCCWNYFIEKTLYSFLSTAFFIVHWDILHFLACFFWFRYWYCFVCFSGNGCLPCPCYKDVNRAVKMIIVVTFPRFLRDFITFLIQSKRALRLIWADYSLGKLADWPTIISRSIRSLF